MLDAPVSGGKTGAHAGTMTVMASGSEAAFAKAQPVLEAISGKVWRLGDEAGIGSTVKMVNQLLAGVHIATAAEALALGIRAGADPRTLFEVICSSAGSSWMWQNRVPHILEGDDTPLSAVNIFVKDLGIVLDQARALTFPLPMAVRRASVVPGGGGAWRGREGRCVRHSGLAGAGGDRASRQTLIRFAPCRRSPFNDGNRRGERSCWDGSRRYWCCYARRRLSPRNPAARLRISASR